MSNSPRSRKSSDAKGNSSRSKKPKSTVDPIPTSESEEKTGVDTSPSLSSEPPLVVEEPVAEKLPIEEPIILEEPVVKTPEPEPVAIVETPVVEETPEPEPVAIVETPVVEETPEPEPVAIVETPVVVKTPEPEPVAIVETPVVEETPEPEPVAIVETPVVEETPEPEPVAIVETPVVEEEPTPEPIVEQTIAEEPPLVEEKPAVVVEEPTPEPLVEDQPKWVNTLATEILFNAEPTSASKVEVVIDSPTTFSYDSVNQSVQPMKEEIIAFLSELPENLGSFFKDYKRPLTTVGLIVAFLITFKILVGLVEIINEIPLIKPTFETVGLGYSAWFIYRYLLKADNRKEISADFNTLKEEILGKKS
ncbi:CAAD domain-containing protein [Planktothrix agardhii]|uniref:CAAD domain-containing protein n=1 Tax=Planktothrix agardhii TaxID=1160 RepID=UPI0020B35997|nr:CAAD domain-containing protein [Planktothrix agardhii]CAD5918126.1 Glutamate--tRNA ligase [Planktothrix agardhii]